jgi:hypothetical protein
MNSGGAIQPAETVTGEQVELRRSGDRRSSGEVATVPISSIVPSDSPRLDGESEGHVHALMETHANLPPIIVHRTTMRVIDGMHRLRVAQRRGFEHIEVEYFDGDDQEAFVLSVTANIAHGLPLSLGDRKAAASRIAHSYPQWSDRRIASVTGLAPSTVGSIRRRSTERNGQSNTRIGRDGRERPLDASAGRLSASNFIKDNPDASIREIADAVRISPSTVQNVRERLRDGKDPLPARQKNGEHAVPASPVGNDNEFNKHKADITASAKPTMDHLKLEPSLRLTDAGRNLLRLLGAHATIIENSTQLVTAVPRHSMEDIAKLAREIGNNWHSFADRLQVRIRNDLG